MRHKIFTQLLERILTAKSQDEINDICAEMTRHAQHTEKITTQDECLLYKVINATNDNRK